MMQCLGLTFFMLTNKILLVLLKIISVQLNLAVLLRYPFFSFSNYLVYQYIFSRTSLPTADWKSNIAECRRGGVVSCPATSFRFIPWQGVMSYVTRLLGVVTDFLLRLLRQHRLPCDRYTEYQGSPADFGRSPFWNLPNFSLYEKL